MIKQKLIPKKRIICFVWKKTFPHRDIKSKWHVSYEEYPENTYPDYCGGFFFLMTNDIIDALNNEILYTKFFWIDDVWLTGIVINKINATLECRKDMIVENVIDKIFIDTKSVKFENLLGVHLGTKVSKITKLWKYLCNLYLNSNYIKNLNKVNLNIEIHVQFVLILFMLIYFLYFSSIIKLQNLLFK